MVARAEPLTRAALAGRAGAPAALPPVRIVHLGLGAFHRAHQAWYTARASDAEEWGIAAFTGRAPDVARVLDAQDGLYTLVERRQEGDEATIVPSIVEAHDGANLGRLVELLAAPTTAIVTITVTEAGYRLLSDGSPDLLDPVVTADLAALSGPSSAPPSSPLARLVVGLDARRRNDAGPIAIVPCDNVPDNGAFAAAGVAAFARALDPGLAAWIEDQVSFVSTSVDRITPTTTERDLAWVVETTGWLDRAAVVTEQFSDWVLSGDFPSGRPDWESAGARFVPHIGRYERRKLWLLNGSHSLLAYLGMLRGHETVASAISDPVCREWVELFWDEAAAHLDASRIELEQYRKALLVRYHNARIEHRLSQIAVDGVGKLRARVAPIALLERSSGRSAEASARIIAGWATVQLDERRLPDAAEAQISAALMAPAAAQADRLVALLAPELGADEVFLSTVRGFIRQFTATRRSE